MSLGAGGQFDQATAGISDTCLINSSTAGTRRPTPPVVVVEDTNFRGEWTANVENVGQGGQIRPTWPSFRTRPTDYERIPYDPRGGNNNWNTLGNGRRPPLPSSDAESNQGPDLSPRPQRPLQPISTDLGAGNQASGQAGQVEAGKDNIDKVNIYQKICY